MSALSEHQFEILPSEDAADGFVFGIGAEVSVGGEGFDPGETSWLTQDSVNTRRGNTAFGRDVQGAKTWLWDSHVDREDVEGALDTLERFADAWHPEELARTPGAQTCVRYRVGGRVRRIYGRPRRFAAPPTNLILNGNVAVTHDFALADAHTYDDLESSASILYSTSADGGGFLLPATLPVETLPSEGAGTGQIYVGGNSGAYPVLRFNGAWTNPVLHTERWTLRLKGTIPSGGWVEIDTRPWALTVLNQSGASVPDMLERRTWLEDLWLAPNAKTQVSLDGIAPAGNASVDIRWRNTWKSI